LVNHRAPTSYPADLTCAGAVTASWRWTVGHLGGFAQMSVSGT
jgi:hypothetical protein